MSWRNRLQPGSFRGVPFLTEAHDAQGGRRLAVHEYPFRDDAFAEDLGRRAREFAIECYILGSDYFPDRDRLLNALEAPGPGVLVHPYRGRLDVAVVDYRQAESTREGGIARFLVRFLETTDPRYPLPQADTPAAVESAAERARLAVLADFEKVFDVAKQAEFFVDAVEAEIARIVDTSRDLSFSIAGLIRTPADLALAIYGGVRDVADALGEPARALKSYQALFNAGSDAEPVPLTTTGRRRQAENQAAAHAIFRRAAVIEAAIASARSSYDALSDAQTAERAVTTGIDAQQEAIDPAGRPVSDEVYLELAGLRESVVADLRARGSKLPRIAYFTSPATQPALVLTHRLYADATRDSELIERNRIRHPGFVPGGRRLEILVDV